MKKISRLIIEAGEKVLNMGAGGKNGGMNRWLVQGTMGLALLTLIADIVLAARVPETYHLEPVLGGLPFDSRTAIWIVAEQQLVWAAFLLGVPMFSVVSEYLGYKNDDKKYDRLAKQAANLLTFGASLTAFWGGIMTFFLIGLYPRVSGYMFHEFFPMWIILSVLIFLEMLTLYAYWYSWDTMKSKRAHIGLGVLLNVWGTGIVIGTSMLIGFMMTPPHDITKGIEITFTSAMLNLSWWPLSLHRLVANFAIGGWIVGMFAALIYFRSTSKEARAYYDWMGFVGNLVGSLALLFLPIAGYIFGYELYEYEPGMLMYSMRGGLSWYFEIQALLVGALYIGTCYYIWTSVRRISGWERFQRIFKIGFLFIFIGMIVWLFPHHWSYTMFGPDHAFAGLPMITRVLQPLALMPMKMVAVTVVGGFTALFFLIYARLIRTGEMEWGVIDPRSQYALIFNGMISIFTINLMGFIRSQMTKEDWFVRGVMLNDMATAVQPRTWYAFVVIAASSLLWLLTLFFVIWFYLKMGKIKMSKEDAKTLVKDTGGD